MKYDQKKPQDIWANLTGKLQHKLYSIERYASLTLIALFPPEHWQKDQDELTHDWQAVGAQLVNHLANKMMLALFAPSRPFFRMDPSDQLIQEAEGAGVSKDSLQEILSLGEAKAVKELDKRATRPKLFQAIKLLVVTGNCLLDTSEEDLRVMSLRYYRAKRDIRGRLQMLVICEKVKFDELAPKVQGVLSTQYQDDTEVEYYKYIYKLPDGKWRECQYVESHELGPDFETIYGKDKLPYHPLTWNLSDESDYGTGLVEEYSGDFEALSTLAEAQLNGAILASEFRWLANPAGMTTPDDFKNSRNGECLPGQEGDLALVQAASEVAAALKVQAEMSAVYVNRLGRAFLMGAAVTRDAERVTAEEIRMVATELEASLGGAYSRIAVDMQLPLARWLLEAINLAVAGKAVEPVIVTGLDALSRNGDLENLKLWLQDMATMSTVPPNFLARLNISAVASALAAGRGIESSRYLLSDEQMQSQQAAAIDNQAQTAGAVAGAEAQAQGTQP